MSVRLGKFCLRVHILLRLLVRLFPTLSPCYQKKNLRPNWTVCFGGGCVKQSRRHIRKKFSHFPWFCLVESLSLCVGERSESGRKILVEELKLFFYWKFFLSTVFYGRKTSWRRKFFWQNKLALVIMRVWLREIIKTFLKSFYFWVNTWHAGNCSFFYNYTLHFFVLVEWPRRLRAGRQENFFCEVLRQSGSRRHRRLPIK